MIWAWLCRFKHVGWADNKIDFDEMDDLVLSNAPDMDLWTYTWINE